MNPVRASNKKSPLLIIFFAIFIDLLGFGIVLPLSPFYAEHFGATGFEVGLLQAVYSLMQFIFAPVWGRLSDRVGRRPIILMSIFGGFISYAVFASAESLWVLFAARAFQGVFAANLSAAQAYIADVTAKEDRAKGMGLIGAAFGLGFIFGPFFGSQFIKWGPSVGKFLGLTSSMGASTSFLGSAFGMGFPALVGSFLCLANFVFAFVKLPESLKAENRVLEKRPGRVSMFFTAMKQPRVVWLIGVFFLTSFAMGNMESTLALLAQERINYGISETGELLAFVGVLIAFTQGFLVRKVAPKWGERKMVVVGPLLAGVGLTLTAFIHSTPAIMLTMAILAVGSGISSPALTSGISLVTDPKDQGGIMGVNQSMGSLARFLGPACGGFLFDFSSSIPYLVGGALMLVACVISLLNASKLPDVRGTAAGGAGAGHQ